MKKTKLHLVLIPFGFLLIGIAFYLNQRMHLSDSVTGFFTGAGLGLLIVAIIKQRRQALRNKTSY